jgi:hypothetical protein
MNYSKVLSKYYFYKQMSCLNAFYIYFHTFLSFPTKATIQFPYSIVIVHKDC